MSDLLNNEEKINTDSIIKEAPKRREKLLTVNERTVVFGLVYAVFAVLYTLAMDFFQVPENEDLLWVMMGAFYLVLMIITCAAEWVIARKKIEIKRNLTFVVAQVAMLIGIIALIVIGNISKVDFVSNSYFSYAFAIILTELVILLYHLIRFVIRCIIDKKH